MIVTSEITGAPYYTHWFVATSRIPLGLWRQFEVDVGFYLILSYQTRGLRHRWNGQAVIRSLAYN